MTVETNIANTLSEFDKAALLMDLRDVVIGYMSPPIEMEYQGCKFVAALQKKGRALNKRLEMLNAVPTE